MMEQAQIQARLLEFLRQGVFSPQTTVSEETDLIANGFDSLSLVSLLQFIEQNFGLWFPENELNEATLKNTRTLTAVIVRLLHERQPSP
jgi:acyl carrier protein